jgi:hypothetical protein
MECYRITYSLSCYDYSVLVPTFRIVLLLFVNRFFIFLVSWVGMGLSPLGTPDTHCHIEPDSDDGWWLVWSSRRNELQEKLYSQKTCHSAALSTTSPTWFDTGLATDPEARVRFPALPEKKVVDMERGPLGLVSTTEELLDRKIAASV